MKSNLFYNLERAESNLTDAQKKVNDVNNARGSYNYVVTVPYTHKCKVSCGGWLKTKWVWKTETRHRNEIRFDQGRFDRDLAEPNKKLTQAKQNFNEAEKAIRNETQSMNNQLTQINKLTNETNSLNNSNNFLQNSLSSHHINSCNAVSRVQNFRLKQEDLKNQKNKFLQETKSLPNKITQLKNDNTNKQNQLDDLNRQNKQVTENKLNSFEILQEKLQSLSEVERAQVAHKMIANKDQVILQILEKIGFFVEKVAQIAVDKNQLTIFNYCLDKGINYDLLINEQDTLASCILKSGNVDFMKQLFSSGQELKMTLFMACVNNDFSSLEVLLKHDSNILQKFKEIEGCGFSLLQYAVASNNAALVDFAVKHDADCFKEAIIGYSSYFEMALVYNSTEIIKSLSANCDVEQELINLVTTNQFDLFNRAINLVDLAQEKNLSIIKSCIDNNCFDIAEVVAQKINDIKQVFLIALGRGDLELISVLIAAKPEELSPEYCTSLIENNHDENISSILSQLLMQASDEAMDYSRQATGEEGYGSYDQ